MTNWFSPPKETAAEAQALVDRGYRYVKIKIGLDDKRDIETVKITRETLGDDVFISVDANQAWTAEQAATFAKRIEDQNIAWFEEPVQSADRHAIRAICRACTYPVAMGESENNVFAFRDLYECGVRHMQPHCHCLPGFDHWQQAVAWTEKTGELWTAGGFSHLTAMFVATRGDGMVEYLRVIVSGSHGEVRETLVAEMKVVDRPEWGDAGLSFVTGAPPSVAAQMLCRGQGLRTGVAGPEFMLPVEAFFAELASRGLPATLGGTPIA